METIAIWNDDTWCFKCEINDVDNNNNDYYITYVNKDIMPLVEEQLQYAGKDFHKYSNNCTC
jgi:hypothetical protein